MEKIQSTNVVLYWNIEDREKLEGLKCKFLMDRIFKPILKLKNVEKVEKVEEWIEKANNLKIRKIDKFVNGLKRDM